MRFRVSAGRSEGVMTWGTAMKALQRLVRGAIALVLISGVGAAGAHPMDPLSADEIVAAANLLLNAGAAQRGAVFQAVDLAEPPKHEVLAGRGARMASVFWRQNKQSFRSTVNLSAGTFTPPRLIPRSEGQLGLTISEVIDFSFAFQDRAFLAALARRGISTPAQLQKVFVTPLTPGSFGLPEEARRIVKAQMYYTEGAAINLFARPIEGVQAIIDLDERRVLQVLDSGVVPIPSATHEFDEATVAASIGLRPPLKPIRITQPEGRNFRIVGNFIEWQKWRLHLRFERRAGTVLSLVTYDGRSVLYQAALGEVFVPYQDPDANWFYRTYMDEGEFGFGTLSSPLALGLDVPANAVLLDGLISAALPDPTLPVVPLALPRVVGVFERLTGNPAWRHFEQFSGGLYEGRAEVELVIRSIAQVGNYDYMIDWIFGQNGTIRGEVALTGIDAAKGVAPGAFGRTPFGTPVAPQLVAVNHSHHFNFRLDLDVDGPNNSFLLGKLEKRPAAGPRKTVWAVDERIIPSEREGVLDHDSAVWKVVNPGRRNATGEAVGYVIESHSSVEPLLDPADYKRAGFIGHPLWITAHRPDELYASGDTPNQNPDTPGLPQYVANNESLANRDIVVWLTMGFHHVPQAEDWPVLSREHLSFELKPSNFFDRNPALDLRRAPFEVR